jgi:hypothetical protein
LGTCYLALSLHARQALPAPLALHMAAAAYAYPLLTRGAPAKRVAAAKHPWARPAAGIMALLAVLAVAIPVLRAAVGGGSAGGGAGGAGALLRLYFPLEAGSWCAWGAGFVSIASFGLSYATVLFGVPLPGNGLQRASGGLKVPAGTATKAD